MSTKERTTVDDKDDVILDNDEVVDCLPPSATVVIDSVRAAETKGRTVDGNARTLVGKSSSEATVTLRNSTDTQIR